MVRHRISWKLYPSGVLGEPKLHKVQKLYLRGGCVHCILSDILQYFVPIKSSFPFCCSWRVLHNMKFILWYDVRLGLYAPRAPVTSDTAIVQRWRIVDGWAAHNRTSLGWSVALSSAIDILLSVRDSCVLNPLNFYKKKIKTARYSIYRIGTKRRPMVHNLTSKVSIRNATLFFEGKTNRQGRFLFLTSCLVSCWSTNGICKCQHEEVSNRSYTVHNNYGVYFTGKRFVWLFINGRLYMPTWQLILTIKNE